MRDRIDFLNEVLAKTKDFVGVPTYAAFGDGRWFYTMQKISWTADGAHAGVHANVDVPIGFVTDLASIPRMFWSVMPRDDVYLSAAVVHDYLYWVQDRPRKAADDIFNIGMSELRVASWKRIPIHRAVSWAGGRAWSNNAELKAAGERRMLRRFPDRPQITWAEWRKERDVLDDRH